MTKILIALIVVYIVDVSGFTTSWRTAVARMLHHREENLRPLKPFDCGQCMTWWVTLIYTFCTEGLSVTGIATCAVLALLSVPMGNLLLLARDICDNIVTTIDRWICRN